MSSDSVCPARILPCDVTQQMSESTKYNETKTPTAAKLRYVATKIAQDIAHAPLKSRNHEELLALNAQLQASDKTMIATSDMITSAITQTQDLVMEAHRWTSANTHGTNLTDMIEQSINHILGVDASAGGGSLTAFTSTTTTTKKKRPHQSHSMSVPSTPSVLLYGDDAPDKAK